MAGVGAIGRIGRIGRPAVRTGGGVAAPAGFYLLRTVPGTIVRTDSNTYVIAPTISGQGLPA